MIAHHAERVFETWRDILALRYPVFARRRMATRDAELIEEMIARYDVQIVDLVVCLAVADWPAIQETVLPWYSRTHPVPELRVILHLFDQLVPYVTTGVGPKSEFARVFLHCDHTAPLNL